MSKNQTITPKGPKINFAAMDMISIALAEEEKKKQLAENQPADTPATPKNEPSNQVSSPKAAPERGRPKTKKDDESGACQFFHLKLTKENMEYVSNIKTLENIDSKSDVVNMIIEMDRKNQGPRLKAAIEHLQKSISTWRK